MPWHSLLCTLRPSSIHHIALSKLHRSKTKGGGLSQVPALGTCLVRDVSKTSKKFHSQALGHLPGVGLAYLARQTNRQGIPGGTTPVDSSMGGAGVSCRHVPQGARQDISSIETLII